MYTIIGRSNGSEFIAYLEDRNNNSETCATMSKDVFVELITRNVDKIVGFEIDIDDEVEYVKVVDDPCLMKPEVTD